MSVTTKQTRLLRAATACSAVAVAMLAVGCSSGTDGSSTPKVGWFTVGANTYMDAQFEAAKKVATAAGVDLEIVDPNFDATKQINQLKDAVSSGQYDALIVTPLNGPGVVPIIKQAIDKGILVFANEAPIGSRTDTIEPQIEGMSGSIMLPQDEFGQRIADLAVDACKGINPCQIAVENLSGSFAGDVAIDKALKAYSAENPAIQVVATIPTSNMRDQAVKATQDILQAHPDVDVIATSGDQVAMGVEIALQRLNRTGTIKINGAGASAPGVERVRTGAWHGTVVNLPADQGAATMQLVADTLNHVGNTATAVDVVSESALPDSLTVDNIGQFPDFAGQWER